MKTKEELNALKERIETVNKKLSELSEEELKQITGGRGEPDPGRGEPIHPFGPFHPHY